MLREALIDETVRLYLFLSSGGVGLTGQSPTVTISRRRDGAFLQSNGSFAGTPALLPMVALDAAGQPGVYFRDFDHSLDGVADEYLAYMRNNNPPFSASVLDVISVKPQLGFPPGTIRGVYLYLANEVTPLGIPGKTPQVALQRESDLRYLDALQTGFQASPQFHNMIEHDGANQPGVYRFNFDQSVDGELRRYGAFFKEATLPVQSHEPLEFLGTAAIAPEGLDFAGIATATADGLGGIAVTAASASSPFSPVRYKLFIEREDLLVAAVDVFSNAHLLGEFREPNLSVFTESDGETLLAPLKTYVLGMRVLDGRGRDDDNMVTRTVEVTGSSRLRLSTGSLQALSEVSGTP